MPRLLVLLATLLLLLLPSCSDRCGQDPWTGQENPECSFSPDDVGDPLYEEDPYYDDYRD